MYALPFNDADSKQANENLHYICDQHEAAKLLEDMHVAWKALTPEERESLRRELRG